MTSSLHLTDVSINSWKELVNSPGPKRFDSKIKIFQDIYTSFHNSVHSTVAQGVTSTHNKRGCAILTKKWHPKIRELT